GRAFIEVRKRSHTGGGTTLFLESGNEARNERNYRFGRTERRPNPPNGAGEDRRSIRSHAHRRLLLRKHTGGRSRPPRRVARPRFPPFPHRPVQLPFAFRNEQRGADIAG